MFSSWSETEDEARAASARAGNGAAPGRDTVGGLLAEALGVLAVEIPSCHAECRAALAGFTIRCRVDDETFDVLVVAGDIVVDAAATAGAADVAVATSRATIRALIQDRVTLEAAVLGNGLTIKGRLSRVESLSRAMLAFLHGAVRSPSCPALLARFERLDQAVP